MKKIEKLIHINTDEKQHVSPDTVFEMCCKINEIIDVLNSWVFEPTLTIPSQSQKQPEKCDCDYCKAYRFSMEKEPEEKLKKEDMLRWLRNGGILKVESEKQEDWRDRIQSFSLGVSESFKIDGEYIDSKEELVAFISQLLSERTFTKKELEIIDWYLTEYETQEGVDKEADRLRKKVSELLKKKQ